MIAVIGGGAAGVLAAGVLAERGFSVSLFEKNEKLGKKLRITGKGRCNLTNAIPPDEFLDKVINNRSFMYSALYNFDSFRTMDFFESLGVPLMTERGSRVYPVSEKAGDIVLALENYLKQNNVKVYLNCSIKEIVVEDGKACAVVLEDGQTLFCDAVIVATGGLSYPKTGSTGDGYKFAKATGHKVTNLYPSLVPLITYEKWVEKLQGLSLKNVSITVNISDEVVYKNFGEMLFTHFGLSGPIILSASAYITGKFNKNPTISIDLKPTLTDKELDLRILRDFEKYINKQFKNSLDDLLPQKLIPVIIELSGISPNKQVNCITKDERKTLVKLLKNLTFTIKSTTGFNDAIITAGGVCVNDINPHTMQSKKVKGLYFIGEVLDVDGYTGGFNLQIAFSTAFLAADSIQYKI